MRKIGRVLCKLGIHKWKYDVNQYTSEEYRSCGKCSETYVNKWDTEVKTLVWRRVA